MGFYISQLANLEAKIYEAKYTMMPDTDARVTIRPPLRF